MPEKIKRIAPQAALIAAVLVAFSPALWNGFVYFDDDAYITQNPHVAGGLTWEGVRWAATGVLNANWHPLTWWSHMLDVSIFGMAAWGHHLHSILLHGLSVCVLFALLRRWGLAMWPALLAAGVWAVHPLRVESVVWAAERKDVLSVIFGLLALLAYDAYARRSGWKWFSTALLCFALGLMAKPMLVTLPCVLLVLDALIYARLSPTLSRSNLRVLAEKLPFFLLTTGSVAITLWAQRDAMQSTELLSLDQRVAVAAYAAVEYLWKTTLPTGLTPIYPLHTEDFTVVGALWRGVLLGFVTAVALLLHRARLPLAGWLIFLGTLVPVSGIMQVGNQSHADRYTYLPSIGLALVMGWVLQSVANRKVVRGVGVAVLCLLIALSAWQTRLWRDTETLFTHTLAHTRDNSIAHNNLGRALLEQGRTQEALGHIEEAVRLAPGNAEARFNLGTAYRVTGEPRKAISMLAPLMPKYLYDPDFHLNLALAMHETRDPQFPVVANNALELLPEGHPARELLLEYLKAF
jgi:hypothetical protein